MRGHIVYSSRTRYAPQDLRVEVPSRVVPVDEVALVVRLVERQFGESDDARLVLNALGVTA